MTEDAKFEDGVEQALRLAAQSPDDIEVISALVQDAVLPVTEMQFDRDQMRFGLLLNRFRWEDKPTAEQLQRDYERVQTVLAIDSTTNVATEGFDATDKELVLSVLSLSFEPGEDGTGDIFVNLAGDGTIRVSVECVDIRMRDVTRPYRAPSGNAPEHKLD